MNRLFLLIFLTFLPALLPTERVQERPRVLTHPEIRTQRRVALVIGNAEYRPAENRLDNPVNDARLVKRTLESVGFEVIHGENLTNQELKNLVDRFRRKLTRGGVALFYYAGHGVQYKGTNFIIPVDVGDLSEDKIQDQAIDVNFVIDEMATAEADVNLIILDACRDNLMTRSWMRKKEGLALISGPKGTVIAYSTSPGRVSDDGKGKENSPYTEALVRWIKQPCLKIEDVFKGVRADVWNVSGNRQLTWESGSLIGDFYFALGKCSTTNYETTEASSPGMATGKSRKVLLHGPRISLFAMIDNPDKDIGKEEELRREFTAPLSAALADQRLIVEDSVNLSERDQAQIAGDLDGIPRRRLERDRNKNRLRWIPYALIFKIHVHMGEPEDDGFALMDRETPKKVKVGVSIFVYRTEDEEIVELYSNNDNIGHGANTAEARRNALRSAAQMIPTTFIKKMADNAN